MRQALAAGAMAFFFCGAAMAQPAGTEATPGYPSPEQRLTREDIAKGKTAADILAEDKAKAADLVRSISLSCDVTDAALVDTEATGGRTVRTYEVACSNGLGYFLAAAEGDKAYGLSCLAAEAQYRADLAAKREPSPRCQLAANRDPLAMAGAVLAHTSVVCTPAKVARIGETSKSRFEYNEVACADGRGFVLVTAQPGLASAPQSISCHDAAQRGIACRMTESGPLVTKQTFVEALSAHGVACAAAADKIHIIGREPAKKRYVVEFYCPAEQPKGLVAFIPLPGSAAAFETYDCQSARKKSAVCRLTPLQP